MCMMCEEEAMYQAYLEYLARKAAEQDKQSSSRIPRADGFACDPAPDTDADGALAAAPKVAS